MKKLTKSAVVPDSLYVMRSADRQIENIIAGMGRPGYVLVSRQMGKTNSLLHAKRRLESSSLKFVYVDLSNAPKTSRGCFRSIVDTALETHLEAFGSGAATKIGQIRSLNLPPHKEHERELLALLGCVEKGLVVILDEIDALVNSDFSDEVFAQIRSIYFSRVTFPLFERLTYLLSGVVEPSQLIKDPKRSPFNIGEKIYLDDFSLAEVTQLLEKADFPLSKDVIEHIYGWTGGHPRMTWEVCSELEDIKSPNSDVLISDVDTAVARLYLHRFDLPPIDHIRELVRVDHEIRGALRVLLTPGHSAIPDYIQRKLYLAGVLKVNSQGSAIDIKNRVFREALSISWLDDIESQGDILPSKGDEQFTLGNFEAAIAFYVQFVNERPALSDEAKWVCYQRIGECFRKQEKYAEAIKWLEKCAWDRTTHLNEHFAIRFELGLCFFQQQNLNEGLALFREVATEHKKSILRCRALVNYGALTLKIGGEFANKEGESIFRKLLEELSSVDFVDLTAPSQLKLVAWYNIARIRASVGDKAAAIAAYHEAAQAGGPIYAPSIGLDILALEEEQSRARTFIRETISSIEKSRLRFSDDTLEILDRGLKLAPFSFEVFVQLVAVACKHGEVPSGLSLVDHVIAIGSIQGGSRSEVLLTLADTLRQIDSKLGIPLLEEARDCLGEMSLPVPKLWRNVITKLLIDKAVHGLETTRDLRDFEKILNSLDNSSELSEDDFHAFVFAALSLRTKQRLDEACDLCSRIILLSKNGGEPAKRNVFIAYFFLAQLNEMRGNRSESRRAATACKQEMVNIDANATSVVGAAAVAEIRKGTDQILARSAVNTPIRLQMPKVGRNDPCPCGSGRKYKKCHGA